MTVPPAMAMPGAAGSGSASQMACRFQQSRLVGSSKGQGRSGRSRRHPSVEWGASAAVREACWVGAARDSTTTARDGASTATVPRLAVLKAKAGAAGKSGRRAFPGWTNEARARYSTNQHAAREEATRRHQFASMDVRVQADVVATEEEIEAARMFPRTTTAGGGPDVVVAAANATPEAP